MRGVRIARLPGVSEIVWLAAAAVTPLAVNLAGCDNFELPKALVVQALAAGAVVAVALSRPAGRVAAANADFASSRAEPADKGNWRRVRGRAPGSFFLLAMGALGAAWLLSVAFSSNRALSLWGASGRQQGLLTLLAYLALAAIVGARLHTWRQASLLLRAIVWPSALVVAYGLMQALGLDPAHWVTDAASPVASTIGRANFLGSYLLIVSPLTLALAMLSPRPWPYMVLLAGQLAALATTQARGAWIGAAAGFAVFGLAWSISMHSRRLALAVLVTMVLLAASIVVLNIPGGPLSALTQIPGLDRLAQLGNAREGSTAARLTIWRAVLPLIAARPLLGYGPEALEAVFAGVFPPQLVYYQGRHTTVDRAHNLWLDLALSGGLAVVLAFLAIITCFAVLAVRGLRRHGSRREALVWTALMASVVGHLVDLQFGFDLTASAMIFWLVLGFSVALDRGLADATSEPEQTLRAGTGFSVLTAWAAWGIIVGVLCARPLLADVVCRRAVDVRRPMADRIDAAQRATHLWPQQVAYFRRLALLQEEAGHYLAAEDQLHLALRLSPNDPGLWAALGDVNLAWGAEAPSRLQDAEASFRKVIELAPTIARYHAALGVTLGLMGSEEEGIRELERAVALDATDGTAYGALAVLYREVGREAAADQAEVNARHFAADWLLPGKRP